MMTKYKIQPVTQKHVNELIKHMRKADREEIWAAMHQTATQALSLCLLASRESYVGLADGKVVCIFGVGSAHLLSTTGVPWLLATDKLEKHARGFLRCNKKKLTEMLLGYTLLRNYVDARNHTAIRWLQWLGFTLLAPEPYGADRLLFYPFEMRALDHV